MADKNNKKDDKNKEEDRKEEDNDDNVETVSLVPKKNKGGDDNFNFNFNFNFGGDSNNLFGGDGGLVSFVSSKLGEMVGSSSGYVESLPKSVQNRVEALKKIDEETQKIEQKFEDEVRALELKYHQLYKPHWAKRAKIITGEEEPPLQKTDDAEKDKADSKDEEAEKVKGIPEFWLTVLKNHHLFEECINKEDEPLLKHLGDITYDPLDNEAGSFTLTFHFQENEYFIDKSLTKTYRISLENSKAICDRVESTQINWKTGKNITKQIKGKLGEENGSFFQFFYPPDLPEENPPEEMVEALELDFELAAVLKDKIIHSAVSWFTGEALNGDSDDDGMGFKFDDPNGEDDDEDYDDDDEEDDEGDGDWDPATANGKHGDCQNQ